MRKVENQPCVSQVLILGEMHAEYLFDLSSFSSDEDLFASAEWEWARLIGLSTKEILGRFGANRIYFEARPGFGRFGKVLAALRRPEGRRIFYAESEYDPDKLPYDKRESNMARLVAVHLSEHPRRKVALVCGSAHAEKVARILVHLLRAGPHIKCDVEYVPSPPGLEDAFPKLQSRSFTT